MAQTISRYLDIHCDDGDSFSKEILNKGLQMRNYVSYMLDRTMQMFEYKGLPPTIPAFALERLLQTAGVVCIAEVPAQYKPRGYGIDFEYAELDDQDVSHETKRLYALYGNFSEYVDPYYGNVGFTVANAGFEPSLSKMYSINKDCVLIRNDMAMCGMLPMYRRYAYEMVEGIISIRSAMINLREQRVIIARSDKAFESAKLYIDKLVAGDLSAIMDEPLLGETDVYNALNGANSITQLIEVVQAFKSAWYQDLGLNPSFTLKREYVSSEEISSNDTLLLPLVDNMLECRKQGVAAVNAMFGTNITVDKASAWLDRERERDLALDEMASEADQNVSHETSDEGGDSGETPDDAS